MDTQLLYVSVRVGEATSVRNIGPQRVCPRSLLYERASMNQSIAVLSAVGFIAISVAAGLRCAADRTAFQVSHGETAAQRDSESAERAAPGGEPA